MTTATGSMSELRVVLLGNSWSERSSVGNLILGENVFSADEEPVHCLRVKGQLTENLVVLIINTPDLLQPNITESVENCVSLSDPGPHVFLLVLQPEDFTEEQKLRLQTVLNHFGDGSFDKSLVLISTPREKSSGENYMNHPTLKDLIRLCRNRYLKQEKLEHSELLTRLSQTMKTNYLNDDPALRRGAGKASVIKSILGQTELHPVSSSSECVKHQGEVCGRWVSLVELPALYGKPQKTVMEESFRCISLCDPEGVHAFILVLPVGPLTDEDKDSFENRIIRCPVKVINDSGGMDQVFNNRDETNCPQVTELLVKTKTTVKKNGGSCYKTEKIYNTNKFIQVERLVKEKEEEMKRQEEELRRKHAAETKQREKQLKEKDEGVNKEREERKKEREEEERRRKREEESLKEEWNKKLEASEKRYQLEREQREAAEKKLELCRKEMRRDREVWDKEKKDMWERTHQDLKQNLEQVKTSYRKMQEDKKLIYSLFVLLLFLLFYILQ